MNSIFCLTGFLMFLSFASFSQEEGKKIRYPVQEKNTYHYTILKTSISNVTTAELSLEKSFSNHFSISFTGAYLFQSLFDEEQFSHVTPGGYKANTEIRFYYKTLSSKSSFARPEGMYCGLQPFFRHSTFNRSITFEKEGDTTQYNNSFGVKNTCFGLNIMAGFQRRVIKRCVIDVYWGFGLMYRQIGHVGLEYNPGAGDTINYGIHDILERFVGILPEQSGLQPNLTGGVRFGIFLNRMGSGN